MAVAFSLHKIQCFTGCHLRLHYGGQNSPGNQCRVCALLRSACAVIAPPAEHVTGGGSSGSDEWLKTLQKWLVRHGPHQVRLCLNYSDVG